MSQLDDTILDALTHVTFPKGFAQAEPAWVVTVDGVDYPLWQTDALVVGSGAAGLRAAVELKRRQQNVLIATAGLYMGTSACSGSDKQTLFTAATAGNGDNFTKLAEALASGGAMDHRHRLCRSGRFFAHSRRVAISWSGITGKIAMARFFVIKPTMTKPAYLVWAAYLKVNGESAVGRSTAPRHSSVDQCNSD